MSRRSCLLVGNSAIALTVVLVARQPVPTAYATPSLSAALPEPASVEPPIDDPGSGVDSLDALRRAIIGQESGGNFLAVNPHSGALGYGQVMPQNLHCSWDGRPKGTCGWDYDALAHDLSSQEFLNSPDTQVQIINHRLGLYLGEETAQGFDHDTAIRRVASRWYSGKPHLYNNTQPQTYGAGSYPSINDYTLSVLGKYKAEK